MGKVNLDWGQIRPLNGSRSDGFEELCAQLARSESPPGSRFERKGRPDAGVDRFAVLPNGQEWAWQAKYFLSAIGDPQWSQVDESVEFVYWGSHELLEWLARPLSVGKLRFFFDARGFDQDWFLARWEEGQPALPLPTLTYMQKQIVVLIAIGLEVCAQVEQSLRKKSPCTQEKCDQQPTYASIPVNERVNRLKLVVDQAQSHQRRNMILGVQVALELAKRIRHLSGRRRDEGRILKGAARRTNPVLTTTEFPWRSAVAAHTFHQIMVQLSDQPQAHWQGPETQDPLLKCPNVVVDFPHIGWSYEESKLLCLVCIEVGEGSLGPLDR